MLSTTPLAAAQSEPPGPKEPPGSTKVAITVDDIPEHGDLTRGVTRMDIARGVLKALKDNNVTQAYGFANGYFMHYDPGEIVILREWLRAGYPLGNHTYEHTDLEQVTPRAYIADIEKADRLLQTLAPVSSLVAHRHVFRYPYLHEGDTLAKRDAVRDYLVKNGYIIAQVTIDYHDWAWTDAYSRCVTQGDDKLVAWLKAHVVDSAERHLRNSKSVARLLFGRDIVHILLIHLGRFDALMLDAILRDFRRKGVKFVTLDEALAEPAYKLNPNLPYKGESTFLEQFAKARKLNIAPFTDTEYTEDRLSEVCKQQTVQ